MIIRPADAQLYVRQDRRFWLVTVQQLFDVMAGQMTTLSDRITSVSNGIASARQDTQSLADLLAQVKAQADGQKVQIDALKGQIVSSLTVSGVSGSDISFPAAFKSVPHIVPIPIFTATQMVVPVVTEVTASKVRFSAMRTKGTLLLSSGPMEAAPAGTTVSAIAIGRV